jgi:hypothetical protein
MSIARAIAAGRQATMRQLGMTEPVGARYARAFRAWLNETGFEEIEKTTRSRLLECLDNLPAIEVWRQQLQPARRRKWNLPHAVLAQWRAHRGARRGQSETETVPVEPEPPPPTEIAWPPEIRHPGARRAARSLAWREKG